jgi:SSS family solute:Na+ symporter
MTHFSWPIDGSIVGVYLLATMVVGIMVRRYVGKVEHFLVAGREMNVYLGVASLAATEFGIVTCMYTAQNGYKYGFAGAIPGLTNVLAMFLIGYTGFGVKPLRDAGVMTIPELFEQRYGRFVRWLSGVVIVLGGLLNMGVFLRMGGQFLVVCCGLDLRYLEVTMTALLIAVAVYTVLGGMLSVLVTDFLQFVVMSAGLIAVTILVLLKVGWGNILAAVDRNYGAAGFNPFLHPDLGWQFALSNTLTSLAAVLTWQPVIARVLAARDSRTGRRIYTRTSFFFIARWMLPGLWAMGALAAATVTPEKLAEIAQRLGEKDGTLFAMPYFLGLTLPSGLMGILVAAMLAADMSTDSSYMLTWGSVIYNDILGPLRRRRPLSERAGLLWNRFIVAAIGLFLLFWGLWYRLEGDLWAYLQLTGTIYLAAMSVLLVACAYWRGANNWGAIAAIVVGAALPVIGLALDKLIQVPVRDAAGQIVMVGDVPKTIGWKSLYIGDHWLNIGTYAATAAAMIIGSWLKNMLVRPVDSDRGATREVRS